MRVGTALRRMAAASIMAGLVLSAPAAAQVAIERIKVHSPSVEGNLEGNSADRDVIVVLPPSYGKESKKRYPVVYFLHGFSATAERYDAVVKFGEAMEGEAARGHEMILVVPDSYTKHGGSMYSDSATVGNFEGFIARDLVAYVDGHYRTLARRDARGLAGHSMGGYGTFKIGMKYPGVFSSLYAMSACCLLPQPMTPERGKALEMLTPEEVLKGDFSVRAMFASAAAWSPAPDKAPLFVDLPTRNGEPDRRVMAQWAANAPDIMIPQYASSLKTMTAIAMDVGDKDTLLGSNQDMDRQLTRFGVTHKFETYDGDHMNHMPLRFRDFVLPFFAEHLATK
ncbi:alpha/beta hydrolase [Sphingobium nicotianae]|uniref:Alpha/beta fold hydrolase n=1 Tax=Sphingobium nicotianae TaxID=2782607 RepID=A0A9X1IS09_9SPHN|nr:alpha/beta fold hydrolase [Sphingobium nicotianae]MBT2187978.1 alpha/beta fold hydrolase [Sphingobium nicotianae]